MLLSKKITFFYTVVLIVSLQDARAGQSSMQAAFDKICETTKKLERHEQMHIREILCKTGELIDELAQEALTAYECACCLESNPSCVEKEYENINNIAKGIHIASEAFERIAIYLESTIQRCATCNMSPEGWHVCKKIMALLLTDCISAFDKKRQGGSDLIMVKLSAARQRITHMAKQLE